MLEYLFQKINTSNPHDLFLDIVLWIILPFGLFLFAFMKMSPETSPNDSATNDILGPLTKNVTDTVSRLKNLKEASYTKEDFNIFTIIKNMILSFFNSKFNSNIMASTIFSITFLTLAFFIYLLTDSIYFKNKLEYINLFYSKYFILVLPLGILFAGFSYFFRKQLFEFINNSSNSSNSSEDSTKFNFKRMIVILIKYWKHSIKYGIGIAILLGLSVLLFKSKSLMILAILFGMMSVIYIIYNGAFKISDTGVQTGGTRDDKKVDGFFKSLIAGILTNLFNTVYGKRGHGTGVATNATTTTNPATNTMTNPATNTTTNPATNTMTNQYTEFTEVFDKLNTFINPVKKIPGLLYKLLLSVVNIKLNKYAVIILVVEFIVLFLLLFSHIIGTNSHKLINGSKPISPENVSDENNELVRDRKIKLEKAILKLKMKIPNLDWDPILKYDLWTPTNESKLEKYMKKYKFKSSKEENNTFLNKFINFNKITYEAAMVYVKTNAPILIKLNYEKSILNTKKYTKNKIESVVLQKEPIYTDKINTIFVENKNIFNYNYSLSSWIYINNQTENIKTAGSNFVSMINYGNKPNIKYNVKNNTLKFVTINGKSVKDIYETNNIQLQKWNHIVINYEAGTMDIFINGNLVSTSKKIVPYMTNDRITIGEESGVSGSIRDTIAFSKPLGLKQIAIIYNALKNT